MAIGSPGRPKARLGVFPMAIALVVAAFLGASLGLVWQSTGLGEDSEGEEVLTGDGDAAEVTAEAAEAAEEEEDAPEPPTSG